MDFGIRATLNGAAGDKISLPTYQYCDFHENGTAATGLVDPWIGADAPTITLVGADKAVNNPAQIADVKSKASSTQLPTSPRSRRRSSPPAGRSRS
jgi:hypothetical protein